jgi:hypothetical protein
MGPSQVIDGLHVTIPAGGWRTFEADQGEFNLEPPGAPNDRVFFWLNVSAVKSTGPGHGTTVLTSVGQSPRALVAWLTHNRDFQVVSAPRQTTIGGVKVTALTDGVSPTAHYGDPNCPANPRCADFFTNTTYWGSNSYGIGGTEQVALWIGTAPNPASAGETFIIALDAPSHGGMLRLQAAAKPILTSIKFTT